MSHHQFVTSAQGWPPAFGPFGVTLRHTDRKEFVKQVLVQRWSPPMPPSSPDLHGREQWCDRRLPRCERLILRLGVAMLVVFLLCCGQAHIYGFLRFLDPHFLFQQVVCENTAQSKLAATPG